MGPYMGVRRLPGGGERPSKVQHISEVTIATLFAFVERVDAAQLALLEKLDRTMRLTQHLNQTKDQGHAI